MGGTAGIPEVASKFSGGGFSKHFLFDDYQKSEVNAFVLSLGNKYNNRYECVRSCAQHRPFLLRDLCRPGGRGVPDIAAQSMTYAFIHKQKMMQMNGTVCATSVRLTVVLRSARP